MTNAVLAREGTDKDRCVVKKPDFFLVGAPKSGTSAMSQYLGAHPDVFMARKEMHFFGADLRFGRQFYRRGPEAYRAEFAARNGERCAGEASVWYLFSEQAAEEIRTYSPEARIIIMLREPVEALYSIYSQFRFDGNEDLRTFGEALAAESDRRVGRRVPRRAYFKQGLNYRETIRYAEQVRRFFTVFGRERVHIIIYDDFAADTASVYQETLEFLGVEPGRYQPEFKVVNGNKSARISPWRFLLNDPLVRSMAIAIGLSLPPAGFRALQRMETRLLQRTTRSEKREALSTELRTELKHEFSPEVLRLSALLGRDLTHWSR